MANKKKQKRVQKALSTPKNDLDLTQLFSALPSDYLHELVDYLRHDPDIDFEPEHYPSAQLDPTYFDSLHDEELTEETNPFRVELEDHESDYFNENYCNPYVLDFNFHKHKFLNRDSNALKLYDEFKKFLQYTVNGETKTINTTNFEEYVYDNDNEHCHLLNFIDEIVFTDEELPLLPISQNTPEFVEQYRNRPGYHILKVKEAREAFFNCNLYCQARIAKYYNNDFEPFTQESEAHLLFNYSHETRLQRQIAAYQMKRYGTTDENEIQKIVDERYKDK